MFADRFGVEMRKPFNPDYVRFIILNEVKQRSILASDKDVELMADFEIEVLVKTRE